jgi:phosphate-selective porin OprO/OprP
MVRNICCLGVFFLSLSLVLAEGAVETPKVGGRLMYDMAFIDSDATDVSSGSEIRRARLFVKGKIADDWSYKLQYDFSASGSAGIRDAYLGYSGLDSIDSIRVGHFTEYGSLEDSTSSKYILCMARALPVQTFVPAARRLGVGVDAYDEGWYAGAGVFGENAAVDNLQSGGAGVSGRFAWMPLLEKRNTVHLGAFGQMRTPRSGETTRYRTRPEVHMFTERLLDTGPISNVNHTVTYGLEAAWIIGSASLQGEYLGVIVDRDDFSAENYSGGYLTASWFFTGEAVAYDAETASLGRVKPLKPLGEDGMGAVALVCRYSTLDLDDAILGGVGENFTVGVNWLPTSHIRFMVNYVDAKATVEGVDTTADIIQLRTQVDF